MREQVFIQEMKRALREYSGSYICKVTVKMEINGEYVVKVSVTHEMIERLESVISFSEADVKRASIDTIPYMSFMCIAKYETLVIKKMRGERLW